MSIEDNEKQPMFYLDIYKGIFSYNDGNGEVINLAACKDLSEEEALAMTAGLKCCCPINKTKTADSISVSRMISLLVRYAMHTDWEECDDYDLDTDVHDFLLQVGRLHKQYTTEKSSQDSSSLFVNTETGEVIKWFDDASYESVCKLSEDELREAKNHCCCFYTGTIVKAGGR